MKKPYDEHNALVLAGWFFLLESTDPAAQMKAVNAFYFVTEIVADSKGNPGY